MRALYLIDREHTRTDMAEQSALDAAPQAQAAKG